MRLNLFINPAGIEGYSTHGIEMLRAMGALGWDMACIPDFQSPGFCKDAAVVEALRRGLKPRGTCPGLKINLALPHRVATFSGSPRIFFTVSEVSRLPPDWVEALNSVDEVWTASEWGRKVFQESGVQRPIRIVPEGVDAAVFRPELASERERTVYRFLAVGKLEERKNYGGLLRAYCEEFEPDEGVELIVHFGLPADAYKFFFNLNLGRRHAPIRFSPTVSTKDQMASLYAEADAFVLPTRGEGWGLPVMEAMACGLPVIATRIGPIGEYATSQTACLLDYELVQARSDPVYGNHFKWGCWAEPNLNQLRKFMRELYENPAKGQEIGRRAAEDVRSQWTWTNAARKAQTALQEAGVGLT